LAEDLPLPASQRFPALRTPAGQPTDALVESPVIDTHCHLTFPDFAGRTEQVLAAAGKAGVTGAICIATGEHDAAEVMALAHKHARVWHSSGVHPCYTHLPHDLAEIARCANSTKCVAWGELGLDRAHAKPDFTLQIPVLHAQLQLIAAMPHGDLRARLPIVLHCREAFADLLPILKQSGIDGSRFVLHCFTGSPADMDQILQAGFMASFTGVCTYKNAAALREAIALCPVERMMVETDAPYLSPEPVRGMRPCEPAFVAHTARKLAELKQMPFEDFHTTINANTQRFFNLPVDAFSPR